MPFSDHTLRNSIIAGLLAGTLAMSIAVISWNLFEFDAALFIYAQALVLSVALTAYRFSIWVHRPPTRVLYQQTIKLLRDSNSKFSCFRHLSARILSYFVLNRFVWKRAANRWAAHWPIMIGCVMALVIVVPLIFGWVWFESDPQNLQNYQVMLFGQAVRTIPVDGVEAFLAFHGLVWASIPVVIGTGVAIWRRMNDRGDQATQTFENDLLPLFLLLAIALTGLCMAASYSFLGGKFHAPIAALHCVIVSGTLIWLPFSKLFHIPQRTLKLAHMVYEHESSKSERVACVRCADKFADRQQIEDLIKIEKKLGYAYELRNEPTKNGDSAEHYQFVCPRCRRATLVIAQSKRWKRKVLEPTV